MRVDIFEGYPTGPEWGWEEGYSFLTLTRYLQLSSHSTPIQVTSLASGLPYQDGSPLRGRVAVVFKLASSKLQLVVAFPVLVLLHTAGLLTFIHLPTAWRAELESLQLLPPELTDTTTTSTTTSPTTSTTFSIPEFTAVAAAATATGGLVLGLSLFLMSLRKGAEAAARATRWSKHIAIAVTNHQKKQTPIAVVTPRARAYSDTPASQESTRPGRRTKDLATLVVG